MLITRTALAALLLAGSLATLTACGKAAPGATNFDPATGKHTPADWATNHGATYLGHQQQCKECHGADLRGGSSGISCSSSNQACHANAPHLIPYPGHSLIDPLLNNRNQCSPCHGSDFSGGTRGEPACSKCHTGLTAIIQLSAPAPVRGECISCHGKTAGPNGKIFPNRSGAHPRHFARVNGNLSCPTCHLGGGSGTPAHGTTLTALVAFPASLNTPSATASYDVTLKNCSNVTCHGGKTTPGWGIGRIATDSNCAACHLSGKGNANAPYNSYSSGHHSGVHVEFGCNVCHVMTYGVLGHFSNLTTHQLELKPINTLLTSFGYTSGNQTCSTPASSCHLSASGHNWRQ